MVKNRLYFAKWPLICLLLTGAWSAFAGEKIQFDIPAERDEQPIDVQETQRQRSSTLGRTSDPGPQTTFRAPTQPSRPTERLSKEELEKKRNWLSNPDVGKDQNPTVEDVFNVTGFSSKSKDQDRQTFLGQRLDTPQNQVPLLKDKKQNDSSYDRMNRFGNTYNPVQADTLSSGSPGMGMEQRSLWDTSAQAQRLSGLPTPVSNFGDFWGDKFNNAPLSDMQNRRSQIAEILDSRTRANDPANSFFDNSRQPVNPVEGFTQKAAGFDSVPQASFTDQWKGNFVPQANLQRNPLEEFRPKIETPLAPKTEITPPVSTWTKPQPGVLPFPKRPGDIF